MKTSIRLFTWLAAAATSVMPAVAAPSCDTWNSKEFFIQATAQDVERCLQAGAGLDVRDEDGATPLHWAAFNANPDVITRLAAAGIDLEARGPGRATPLHIAAAASANPDVITRLVEAGAGPEARNEDGMTPLHIAAALNDNPGVITRLVELGADGKAKTADGKTAWDLAQDNEALRGTKAWWLLNEFRFE